MNNGWREVPGYGGRYYANAVGDVIGRRGKRLARLEGKQGPSVVLWKDGYTKEKKLLMVVVAETFLGGKPEGKIAYHINGNKQDNRCENIGFCTRKEFGQMVGGDSRRKTVAKIDRSGFPIAFYRSAREAARQNHMSYQTVIDRCNHKVKKEYELDGSTYRWEEEIDEIGGYEKWTK